MTRRQAAIAVAALLLVIAVLVVVKRSAPPPATSERVVEGQSPAAEAEGDENRVTLYFPGGAGRLIAEQREIALDEADTELHAIAAEVLAGPASAELFAPFPPDTEVGSVFVSESGIAYVDLVSTRADPPRSGSRQEMLSVYSLVNSVQSNLPELTGVVLLWNGQQRATFAGHLDTGRPLTANPGLVAAASEATPVDPRDPSRP